tara:strand:- start:467 stop:1321 length:855 start_codon:yes stop_codon:yes gene_type:complete
MSCEFSVVANFYIDTEERLLRLKDSYYSFSKSNISNWKINIRGELKYEVEKFLRSQIKERILDIQFLETKDGWIADTETLLKDIKDKIIFFWIEDHICIQDYKIINELVDEMYLYKVDHMLYTFFHKGQILKVLESVDCNEKKLLKFIDLNNENYEKFNQWYYNKKITPDYLVSLCSFMNIDFFKKNLEVSKNKTKYNAMLPFNFERSFQEKELIPFTAGFLKKELFVSIDDDHGEDGYSLISRGLYEKRKSKQEMDKIRSNKVNIYKESILKKIKNIFKNIIR